VLVVIVPRGKMPEPEDVRSMIPITQIEALLEQQRFVPGRGGPRVSVSTGALPPDLGIAVPLPENVTGLVSAHYRDPENESLEIIYSSTFARDEIESFYKSQLGVRGYEVSEQPMMPLQAFQVSGETAMRPLILCAGPKSPAWSIATRSGSGPNTVFIRIHFDPSHSPCAHRRSLPEFHRSLMARMPSLSLPANTKVQNLGSSASDRDASQSASLSGETSVAEIVSSFLDSLAETRFSVVASETGSAMGYVEWASEDTGDVGIVTVVCFGNSPGQFELTSKMRLGSGSPPTQGRGFSSIPLS